MNDRAIQLEPGFGWRQARLALLAYAHIVVCAVSLYCITITNSFPAVIGFEKSHLAAAILNVVAFSPVVILFVIGRF
ncbi:hypothetical protein ABTL31_19000, partial [Acinetobacter baumannii]